MRTSNRLAALAGRSGYVERVGRLTGGKLGDLAAAIAGFQEHGLTPRIVFDGERYEEPGDLLVVYSADTGTITDVLVTGYGLERLRTHPVPIDVPADRELAPGEARAAFERAFTTMPALVRSR